MDAETIAFVSLSLMNGSAVISIFFSEEKSSLFGGALAIATLVILSLMTTNTFIGENKVNPVEYGILGLPFLLCCIIGIWDLYRKDNTDMIMMFINKMYILWMSVVYIINGFSHYLFDK